MSNMKEKQNLELIKEVCDWYYKKTEDPFYERVSKQTARKIRRDIKYADKLTKPKRRDNMGA